MLTSNGANDPLVGCTLGNRYRIERALGTGAMGTVYCARQIDTGTTVSIKVLHPQLTADPGLVLRFEREAFATSRLDHPNALRVLDFGEDGTGWQFKYLTRGGGYYFNVGGSDLVAARKIRLVQFSDIEAFEKKGARLRSGETLAADLIVLATGWKGQEALVGKLFGAAVAARVGPVWGFGEDQELRNMFRRTPQPGLWFIAGSFAQCRIYSRYLALQIQKDLIARSRPGRSTPRDRPAARSAAGRTRTGSRSSPRPSGS